MRTFLADTFELAALGTFIALILLLTRAAAPLV